MEQIIGKILSDVATIDNFLTDLDSSAKAKLVTKNVTIRYKDSNGHDQYFNLEDDQIIDLMQTWVTKTRADLIANGYWNEHPQNKR
jgi:hypothetical protein